MVAGLIMPKQVSSFITAPCDRSGGMPERNGAI